MLTSKQRAYLRGLANSFETILIVGKGEITGNIIMQADTALTARLIEEAFPKLKDGKVQIFPIGATIGCHTGPGTVALFFWGGPRV